MVLSKLAQSQRVRLVALAAIFYSVWKRLGVKGLRGAFGAAFLLWLYQFSASRPSKLATPKG